MPTARKWLLAAAVNEKLYAVGGDVSARLETATVERYAAGSWTTVAPLPTARFQLCGGVLDGYIYAVGGAIGNNELPVADVERYNPASDTWAAVAPLPEARKQAACAVSGGRLWVSGGVTGSGVDAARDNVLLRYDPDKDLWASVSTIPGEGRSAHASAAWG